MYLLPAIDILDGRAVRLEQGDYSKVTVYNEDPVLQAQLFEEAGAEWLHLVDLDGARSGQPANIAVVEAILRRTALKVEVGGGVRSMDAIARLADAGANRVVLGTALVRQRDFAQQAVEEYEGLLAAGIDARNGEVAVDGWEQGAALSARDFAARVGALGYEHLVYTDIARDGMQTGIDPQAYTAMAAAFGKPVIASGGVASLADIEALAQVADAVEGVIAGRAIYEGSLTVADGVAACRGTLEAASLAAEQQPLTLADLEQR